MFSHPDSPEETARPPSPLGNGFEKLASLVPQGLWDIGLSSRRAMQFGFLWLIFVNWIALAGSSADNRVITLHVIATADFHGSLTPRLVDGVAIGGVDVIASYFDILRRTNPDGVVLLDAGDVYQGSFLSAASEGETVMGFYNDLGYDAMVIGNHEFDYGPQRVGSAPTSRDDLLGVIKARIQQARFPVLGANILERSTGEMPLWKNLKPYTVIKRKGITIGIIGLTSERTALITNPANVRPLDFTPRLETLHRVVPEVRARGATVVILLIHDSLFDKPDTAELVGPVATLARQLQAGEIDLIVSGHSHRALSGTINEIPVIQPAPYGAGFAEAELVVDARRGTVIAEKTKLVSHVPYVRKNRDGSSPLFHRMVVRTDRRMAKKLRTLRASVEKQERVYIGRAKGRFDNRTRLDSPVGRLVTDAMRAHDAGIEIALYNAGGLRAPIYKGVINAGRLYEVVPFDNTLVMLSLTGWQIVEILERGLKNDYGIMEVSGITVRFDPAMPVGKRVVGVYLINGTEMERNRSYRVATNDFIFAGGDGYLNPTEGGDANDTHVLIREIVARYIRDKKNIAPDFKERYVEIKAASSR